MSVSFWFQKRVAPMPNDHIEKFRWLNRALFGVAAVVFADQWSKDIFATQLRFNSGVAFSVLEGAPAYLLIGFLALFLIAVFVLVKPLLMQGTWGFLSGSLFFGGALSNILDRLKYAAVRDIWLIPGTQIWNNLADWCIALGVLGFIIIAWQKKHYD